MSIPLSGATLMLVLGVQILIAAGQSKGDFILLSFVGGGCLLFVPILIALAVLEMVERRLKDTVRRR